MNKGKNKECQAKNIMNYKILLMFADINHLRKNMHTSCAMRKEV